MNEGVPRIHIWMELDSVGTHLLLQQSLAEFLQQWETAPGETMVGGGKIPAWRLKGFEIYQKKLNASPSLKEEYSLPF